jgi:hypothetical protein
MYEYYRTTRYRQHSHHFGILQLPIVGSKQTGRKVRCYVRHMLIHNDRARIPHFASASQFTLS